ncbi:hypothetical protein MHU86_23705 [Fragilaria crotonensis]|nr:hypothetical protein MHU86_23705 [Fragilaria crotonensis]
MQCLCVAYVWSSPSFCFVVGSCYQGQQSGAFSLFCCGPQTFARAAAIGREASDHASTLVQMQLKTTDTTTGFSEKDIKSMTKLNFTVPKDFHELARLIENMSGVLELLSGANSPLTHMLDEWSRFLTRAVGSTLATLRQLAHADPQPRAD